MKTKTLAVKRPRLTTSRGILVGSKPTRTLKIKSVLVPLDFSPASHAAIQSTLPWLSRFGAKLHLIHVLPADSAASAVADLPMVVPNVEIGRRVRRGLGKAAEDYGIETNRADLHMRRGSPFAQICALARTSAIDLIVIATRGMTGLKHVLLGSTAERVVRYSPCPVLVVRRPSDGDKERHNGSISRSEGPIKRILVPVDFSDRSARSLKYAKQLAIEFDATLILLHSIALQYYVSSAEYPRYDFQLIQRAEEVARQRMRELIARAERDGIRAEPSLQVGHAGQQICVRAVAEKADLIVTSTHGWTGLKHVLIGSTAEYVVRHASCPVLVVPTHDRSIPG